MHHILTQKYISFSHTPYIQYAVYCSHNNQQLFSYQSVPGDNQLIFVVEL